MSAGWRGDARLGLRAPGIWDNPGGADGAAVRGGCPGNEALQALLAAGGLSGQHLLLPLLHLRVEAGESEHKRLLLGPQRSRRLSVATHLLREHDC